MKENQQLWSGVADAARAVLVVRSDDPEVRRHIAGLLNSVDDALSYDQVLEELKALRAGRPPSTEFVADNATICEQRNSPPSRRCWQHSRDGKRADNSTRSPGFNLPTPFPTFS